MMKRPAPSAPANAWRPEVLNRLEFLLLLAALTLAVLAYPPRLENDWLRTLMLWDKGGSLGAWLVREQFEDFLSSNFSVLILKGVLAAVPALAFVAARAVRWLMAPATLAPAPEGRRGWLSLAAFFGWAALSAAWSPTRALSGEAAIWALVFGAFVFALLRRGLSALEVRLLAHYLLALGLLAMAITFLEALPENFPLLGGKIFLFLSKFDNIRNRYGSLLGHNTAAASFLMLTAFPCFFLLLGARTKRGGIFYGVYLALVLLAVLILQSRAIWVLLPLLGLLALRSGLRATRAGGRLRWLPAGLLALLALGLATQTINRPWNPFYIRDNPLGRRIKDLSLTGLKGEARLRLNIISATLVPDHPWIGHGLFAFQYVYPRRQAEYFNAHPDSWLNMTRDRSNMAHNEYMQVAVDHGLVGLALLGWGLGAIAVRGRRRRRELAGAPRLLHEGFGWSALAFALHAGVDFPFHLPMLVLPGLVCLTAWGANRERLEPAGPAAPERLEAVTAGTFRPQVFARLLGAFLAFFLVPLGSYPLIKCLQGDVFYRRGEAAFHSYAEALATADVEKQVRFLTDALDAFVMANQLAPYNALMQLEQADVYQRLGNLSVDVAERQARQPAGAAAAAETAAEARQFLKLGFAALDQVGRGMDYHELYAVRAELYRSLARLDPKGDAERLYRKNLALAMYYCPAMSEYTMAMLWTIEHGPNPDPAELLRLRRRLLATDSGNFRRIYILPANKALRDWNYARAASMWEEILKVDPQNTEFLNMVARASLMAGRRQRAMEVVRQLYRIDDVSLMVKGGIIAKLAIEQDYVGMVAFFHYMGVPDEEHAVRADFRAMEIEMRRRQGQNQEPAIIARPRGLDEGSWALAVAEAMPAVLFHDFDDPPRARQALQTRLALKGPAPGIRFWIEGFYIAEALQDLPLMGRCLAEARDLDAQAPPEESRKATLADLTARTAAAPEKHLGQSTKPGAQPIGN